LYHYYPLKHTLECLKPGDFSSLLRFVTFGEGFVEAASFVFIISGSYERLRWKYGERSYRFMCIDVGFLAENIYLTAEGLGLGACAVSGFAQDAVEDMLDVDGNDELALLLMTVGPV